MTAIKSKAIRDFSLRSRYTGQRKIAILLPFSSSRLNGRRNFPTIKTAALRNVLKFDDVQRATEILSEA